MLWKYAKFQTSGSEVRNKNSYEKLRTDKIKEKSATIQFRIIMSSHILSRNIYVKMYSIVIVPVILWRCEC
jgi:hypothetical protein